MSEIAERQQKIVAEFEPLTSWEDKYSHVIQLGKDLNPIAEKYQNDEYRVRGCQSVVWMFAEVDEDKRLKILADAEAEAKIVRGLISILLRVYSGAKLSEILVSKNDFLDQIGLSTHLSPSRANGLNSMLKQIKFYALAYSAKQ